MWHSLPLHQLYCSDTAIIRLSMNVSIIYGVYIKIGKSKVLEELEQTTKAILEIVASDSIKDLTSGLTPCQMASYQKPHLIIHLWDGMRPSIKILLIFIRSMTSLSTSSRNMSDLDIQILIQKQLLESHPSSHEKIMMRNGIGLISREKLSSLTLLILTFQLSILVPMKRRSGTSGLPTLIRALSRTIYLLIYSLIQPDSMLLGGESSFKHQLSILMRSLQDSIHNGQRSKSLNCWKASTLLSLPWPLTNLTQNLDNKWRQK